jgi:hypothetical protein
MVNFPSKARPVGYPKNVIPYIEDGEVDGVGVGAWIHLSLKTSRFSRITIKSIRFGFVNLVKTDQFEFENSKF